MLNSRDRWSKEVQDRAEKLHEQHRISGSRFWHEMPDHDQLPWLLCAAVEERLERLLSRIAAADDSTFYGDDYEAEIQAAVAEASDSLDGPGWPD